MCLGGRGVQGGVYAESGSLQVVAKRECEPARVRLRDAGGHTGTDTAASPGPGGRLAADLRRGWRG